MMAAKESDAWAPYEPSERDPWDIRRVGHLHRRAGFGPRLGELRRDLDEGPTPSIERFLQPPAPRELDLQVIDSFHRAALSADDGMKLRTAWLYRMLVTTDPLRERMTLFWHDHFATSNRKVASTALMHRQNDLFRRHALGDFRQLLTDVVGDGAMLVWLDGAKSRKEDPNENFAREFLELFTLGRGHYTEADVRAAARAFTGWTADYSGDPSRSTRAYRYDPALADLSKKTFLGQTGPWNHEDIIRIALEQPATARLLCRKLYRYFVRETDEALGEAIEPLATIFRMRYSVRDVVETILRSRRFFSSSAWRQKIKSPVEFCLGLVRTLEVPRRHVNLPALAAACGRQGQELFDPPSVKGWDGGRAWLNSLALIDRSNVVNHVVEGNATLGIGPYAPRAWARTNGVPPQEIPESWLRILVDEALGEPRRRTTLQNAQHDSTEEELRRVLTRILLSPEFHLA